MSLRRVRFTFSSDLVTRPIIYDMGHKFEVITNIRRADVNHETGWVVLELEGAADEIDRAVDWVQVQGVGVSPLEGDVLEG